jgi:hypothetical protein
LYLKARCSASTDGGGISELDLMKLWKALWHTLYMADRKPVQDELSKQISQLIWCLAGTEEEDEYAGQAYFEMMQDEDEGDGEDDDDDDPDVTLEEIENTLEDQDDGDEEESDEDSNEKQLNKQNGYEDDGMEEDDDDDDDVDHSEVPHCRGAHLASLFIRTFFRTVRRDWDKMDKYRVDKFYTLIRLMIHQVYKYMALRHWNFGIIRLFNDAIFDEILSQLPNGLRYHLIDLSLEELAKVSAKASMPLTEATFLDVLEPYLAMTQTGAKDPTVQARVMEGIVENFLDNYSVVSDNAIRLREEKEGDEKDRTKGKDSSERKKENKSNEGEEDDDDEEEEGKIVILDQVHVGTIAEFIFDLASDPATGDQYRKSLYEMHKKYTRRLKKIGTDVDIGGNEADDDDDDDYNDIDQLEEEVEMGEDTGDMPGMLEDKELEEEEETPKKGKPSKKRKAKEDPDEKAEADIESAPNSKSEKKKRKKKKKNKHNDGNDDDSKKIDQANVNGNNHDEEVVISLSEQKEAKKFEDDAMKKKKKAKRKKDDGGDHDSTKKQSTKSPGSSGKKVKFDKVNRSKSHKASMRALVTSTPPNTTERTPEKGILRNKGTRSPALLSKSNRKKAANYF